MSEKIAPPSPDAASHRSLWVAYGCACAVGWLLYVLAGAEFQRGLWQLWQAVYQATLALWPPMLLGVAVFPWVRRMQDGQAGTALQLTLHVVGAIAFRHSNKNAAENFPRASLLRMLSTASCIPISASLAESWA